MKMQKLFALFVVISSLTLAGCPKKQTVADESSAGSSGTVTDEQVNGGTADSDSGNAMGLQTIRFPYDSFEIVGENKDILKSNIKILKANPTVNIQIEGHCDERGTEEYNRALGERRALAIRERLAKAGISPDRLRTVSFGEDKPLALGHDEAAWRQNRRGELILLRPKN